jgi:hypothetical protein
MESTKLSQEVIDQIKSIQQKNQAIEVELGQIELIKLAVKQRRLNAEQYLSELKDEEKTLAEFLEEEYGNGTINIEEGIFIPTQSQEE